MSDKPDVLDFDDLMPKDRVIKFEGVNITIKPPKMPEFMYLGQLAGKLSEADKLEEADLTELIGKIQAQICKLIPELEGKALNSANITKLMEIITDMGMPTDSKELESRGITPNTDEVDDPKKG